MKTKMLLGIGLSIFVLLACVCTSSSEIVVNPSDAFEQEPSQRQAISTEEPESKSTLTATKTLELTLTEQLLQSPESIATSQPSQTLEPSPTVEPLLDVFSILGKPVHEVEATIGQTELIIQKGNNDHFVGGEYRDYTIGDYGVFVTYDNGGIARIFQVETGLSDENYSLEDWNLILPKFGINLGSPPEREFPAAVYWDNYDGYYIAIFASNISGAPVWSVQISEASYLP